MRPAVVLLVSGVGWGAFASPPGQRALTFDDRLRADRTIERVDDRQRIGAAQMAALEAAWHLSITDDMLERELSRMAREAGSPERLLALYAALGNDPFLIKECLARPSLVLRTSQDLFSFDPAIHAKARAAAAELRRRLAVGELRPSADHPGRSVYELALQGSEEVEPFRYRLSPEEFRKRRALLPHDVLRVSAIEEERDGFVLSVVLEETARDVRVARYVVPKSTWEAWWAAARESLRAEPIFAVAADGGVLPVPIARPAGRRLFSGTVGSASDLHVFRFCAVAGDPITAEIEGDLDRDPTAFRPSVLVFDETGGQLPASGRVLVAPTTGAYSAVVPGEAPTARGDYSLSIAVGGETSPPETVDLSVTASVAPDSVEAGGLLTYTIVMTNAGPGTALDATMLDPLPVGTTHESLAWSGPQENWTCVAPALGTNGKVSCTNKCFAPGDSVTFTIVVRVDRCAGSDQLKNVATASSLGIETNPADNAATATATVLDPGSCDDGNLCTSGDRCGPTPGFAENFDLVEAPVLPQGWTAILLAGPPGAVSWRTRAYYYDTEPNSVFIPDASDIRDCVLESPHIPILAPNAQLTFRNFYNLERDFDGGVLEIQIAAGEPFQDILAVGGSFETGDYTGTISSNYGSPISGRRAWTGAVSQFVLTTVNLPARAFGQTIVLRWRMATDRLLGAVGQWIDSVAITGRNVCQPGTVLTCDDGNACTADSCDPAAGCGHVAVFCDDGNSCTDDTCDAGLQCVYTNNTAPCDDLNACTRTDACRAGACVGSGPVDCRDADVCTADVCDPAIGCVTTTANFDEVGFSASRVDGRDLAVLAGAWNSCPGNARYNPAANLDRQDPCVGATDFHLFMSTFGRTCGS